MVFYIVALVLGLLIGSFLNVVIYRLPKMMHIAWDAECKDYLSSKEASLKEGTETEGKTEEFSSPSEVFNLAVPNSTCPNCKSAIKPWQNIPVISYLFLKGSCANCKVAISPRYPIVEAVTGLLSLFVVYHFGASPQAYFGLILLWSLICLTMIDADHQLLPDSITLPLLWLGIIVNYMGTYASLEESVIGAIAGYLSLWSVYWGFKIATGKEGMGFGDFKLLAALGAWMGWQYLPLIIILSSFVGAVIGIGGILIMGRDKAKPMPFGPYLAIAGLIAFFWGDALIAKYLQFVNPTLPY